MAKYEIAGFRDAPIVTAIMKGHGGIVRFYAGGAPEHLFETVEMAAKDMASLRLVPSARKSTQVNVGEDHNGS